MQNMNLFTLYGVDLCIICTRCKRKYIFNLYSVYPTYYSEEIKMLALLWLLASARTKNISPHS